MRTKLTFLAGVGVGYVLGARAGRERYEQLLRAARTFRENPTVQETAGILQAQAGSLVSSAKHTVTDKLSHTSLGARMSHFREHHQAGAHAGSNGLPASPPAEP
jgi:hypothetical protein